MLYVYLSLKKEQYVVSSFLSTAPRFAKGIFFAGTQASRVCHSNSTHIRMKTSMEYWWNDIDRTEVLAEKSVPLLICLLQILYELVRDRNQISAVRGQRLPGYHLLL